MEWGEWGTRCFFSPMRARGKPRPLVATPPMIGCPWSKERWVVVVGPHAKLYVNLTLTQNLTLNLNPNLNLTLTLNLTLKPNPNPKLNPVKLYLKLNLSGKGNLPRAILGKK